MVKELKQSNMIDISLPENIVAIKSLKIYKDKPETKIKYMQRCLLNNVEDKHKVTKADTEEFFLHEEDELLIFTTEGNQYIPTPEEEKDHSEMYNQLYIIQAAEMLRNNKKGGD
jgi:hypothetical protein